MIRIFLYLAVIITANVVTASLQPLVFWHFIVPAGTFFIGLTFSLEILFKDSLGERRHTR